MKNLQFIKVDPSHYKATSEEGSVADNAKNHSIIEDTFVPWLVALDAVNIQEPDRVNVQFNESEQDKL